MSQKDTSFDTRLIHAGEPKNRIEGAVNVPIFQSSTFEYAGQSSYDELKYIRLNNCLLYTSPSPRDLSTSRMPSSA